MEIRTLNQQSPKLCAWGKKKISEWFISLLNYQIKGKTVSYGA